MSRCEHGFLLNAGLCRIRVHDLRATRGAGGANGKSEAWVADRTGHTTSAMINRYRRAAWSATELGLGSPTSWTRPSQISPLPHLCPTQGTVDGPPIAK